MGRGRGAEGTCDKIIAAIRRYAASRSANRVPAAALIAMLGLATAMWVALPAAVAAPNPDSPPAITQTGLASWYGPGFAGQRTADGERFKPSALTAAHRWLPFGTIVRVTNLETGRMLKVRVNDRGPYHAGRIIDLSAKAAKLLAIRKPGIAPVRLKVVAQDQPPEVAQILEAQASSNPYQDETARRFPDADS